MITSFKDISPKIGKGTFIAPNAMVIGDVVLGEDCSVWFGAVIRGDVHSIRIGSKTNIQDLTMVHVTTKESAKPAPIIIGDFVTIGHRVVVHGCQIGNRCLIGMGSIILDNAVIEDDCFIGAGSLVSPGTVIPGKSLALGSPARVKRPLSEEELQFLRASAAHYCELAKNYQKEKWIQN
ncbi:MAG: gamma carbonic anhydrase family protein [Deltaproteobacteria bacterium RIFCSPLOWO2_12_FULL_40_28]|nr:MAG: gamma carbonic anhydrase family protein [Deltaproteobacteria bacterium RIFCSPHIGHO2_02_FULL_40_28]OGQ20488.1 MAG: gamma carbonic anhydrase family protein [Deltaproteobacteria bacterium RIFCSPHIGHO2_12_FULL_40_32]OGQ41118.1 MAG: gamma carbonic anhydrase family protein [Deltaproteobacteria bacterium RIFCSPLOWO2_02_FULL_40_36]OGQ55098.1 MAG: gamma carbonic anhydrase family protein [Deltaproteobacteria bacterium RIFCSPLOWO2_12_FULL_40_28]